MDIPEDIDRACQLIEQFAAHLDEGGRYDHRNVAEIADLSVRVARYFREFAAEHEKLIRDARHACLQYKSLITLYSRQEPYLLQILELRARGEAATADNLYSWLNADKPALPTAPNQD